MNQMQWKARNPHLWTCDLCGGGHSNGYCESSCHVPEKQATYMGNPPRFQNDPYFNNYNMEGRTTPITHRTTKAHTHIATKAISLMESHH